MLHGFGRRIARRVQRTRTAVGYWWLEQTEWWRELRLPWRRRRPVMHDRVGLADRWVESTAGLRRRTRRLVRSAAHGPRLLPGLLLAPFTALGGAFAALGRSVMRGLRSIGAALSTGAGSLGSGTSRGFRALGRGFSALGSGITAPFRAVGRGLAAVGAGITGAFRAVGRGLAAVGAGITGAFRAVGRGFTALGGGVAGGFRSAGSGTARGVRALGSGSARGVRAIGRGFTAVGSGTGRGAGAVGRGSRALGAGMLAAVGSVGRGTGHGLGAVGRSTRRGVSAIGSASARTVRHPATRWVAAAAAVVVVVGVALVSLQPGAQPPRESERASSPEAAEPAAATSSVLGPGLDAPGIDLAVSPEGSGDLVVVERVIAPRPLKVLPLSAPPLPPQSDATAPRLVDVQITADGAQVPVGGDGEIVGEQDVTLLRPATTFELRYRVVGADHVSLTAPAGRATLSMRPATSGALASAPAVVHVRGAVVHTLVCVDEPRDRQLCGIDEGDGWQTEPVTAATSSVLALVDLPTTA